jgi:hypothetical protein
MKTWRWNLQNGIAPLSHKLMRAAQFSCRWPNHQAKLSPAICAARFATGCVQA